MKKLMIALAIVCAAAITQAATVSWTSGKLYTAASVDGGFSTTAVKAGASAYLFTITADQYNSFLADYNETGNMASVYDAFKDSLTTATQTGKTASLTSLNTLKTEADVGATVYGAIIYTTSQTFGEETKDFYIANIATGTVGSDAGITIANLGTDISAVRAQIPLAVGRRFRSLPLASCCSSALRVSHSVAVARKLLRGLIIADLNRGR